MERKQILERLERPTLSRIFKNENIKDLFYEKKNTKKKEKKKERKNTRWKKKRKKEVEREAYVSLQ